MISDERFAVWQVNGFGRIDWNEPLKVNITYV